MAVSNRTHRFSILATLTVLTMLSVLVTACDLFRPDVWQERLTELERQRAIWEQRGIHDYVYTLNRVGQIPFNVRIRVEADTVRSATYITTGDSVPEGSAGLAT
ncbi:MAG: DUF6174 domain-containing protein, partial [Gemmatimonadota bacterium]